MRTVSSRHSREAQPAPVTDTAPVHRSRQERRDHFYDPARVVEIDIRVDPARWQELCGAAPRGGVCNFEFTGSRYDWSEADSMTIDGTTFEQVGVRKRSWCGSLSNTKPALKLKLDKYIEENESRAESTLGTANLSLSNAVQDPALIRQCLGYDLVRKAGLPAPRCNLAEVRVNGDSLGLYVNVEPLDKSFLASRFGRPLGDLYELEGTDLAPWALTRLNPDVEAESGRGTDMRAAVRALEEEGIPAFERLFDPERFVRFWAMENLLGHWDGFTNNVNNTFLYSNPSTQRFEMIPWGLDQILTPRPAPRSPLDIYRGSKITSLLEQDPRYVERLSREVDDLLDNVFVERELQASIGDYVTLARPRLPEEAMPAFEEAIQVLRSTVDATRAQMKKVFTTDTAPDGTPICRRPAQTLGIREAEPLESFEDGSESGLSWSASTQYSGALEISMATEGASDGARSLALSYGTRVAAAGDAVAAAIFDGVFREEAGRGRDLSNVGGIALDLEVPQSSGMNVSLAVSTGPGWTWQETESLPLQAGWNRDLTFTLAGRGFRDLDDTRRLSLKLTGIRSTPEGVGTVRLDHLRKVQLETAREGFERGQRCVYLAANG